MANKRVALRPYLSTDELFERYKGCKAAKEARRWQALWLVSQGRRPAEVAPLVGLCDTWIRRIMKAYNKEGPETVPDGHQRRPGGPRRRLDAEQQRRLLAALEGDPPGGGLWTGPKVAAWITKATGRPTYPQLGWVYLRRFGLRLRVPRRRHIRAATPEEQALFKKTSRPRSPR